MSLRPLLSLALALLLFGGCGDDDTGGVATRTPARADEKPCPPGTPSIGVRDILPPLPAGMTLLDMRDEPPPAASETREPMTIAGRPGQIMVAPADTGARASGSVGACGVLTLRGPDEASVRRVASMIRQPD